MSDEGVHPTKQPPDKARKRKSQPDTWKRNVAKKNRYAPISMPEPPKCKHSKNSVFKCFSVKMRDLQRFHSVFYNNRNKIQQDYFILKHCGVVNAKQKLGVRRKLTYKFHIRCASDGSLIPVCRETFLRSLGLKKDRVQGVLKRYHSSEGQIPKENRGGDRKGARYLPKRESVCKFIESLKCKEPHYCRSKSNKRLYLPGELSIKKLWRIYSNSAPDNLQVKVSYFRHIFNSFYNIGFGSPRVDACSKCMELTERLKTEKDLDKKQKLFVEKRIHKLRAKAFFNLVQEEKNDLITLSFDCQKNMALPRLPDQSAYFSRQLNLYNFAIVVGSSHSALTKDNVFSYTWNESLYCKSSNEISSAVYDCLISLKEEIKGKSTVRLIADGCGGQNKNTILMCMACKWLQCDAPSSVTKVEVVFPVVGHSFIPPDRVFAQIEKKIRPKDIIVKPKDYEDIISNHSTLKKLGEDAEVYDWRAETRRVLLPVGKWHVRFNACKRFFLTKSRKRDIGPDVKLQGECFYKSEIGKAAFITNKGMRIVDVQPARIPRGKPIASAKIKDVHKLLQKHYGDSWKTFDDLQFYVNFRETAQDGNEDIQCEAHEIEEDDNRV